MHARTRLAKWGCLATALACVSVAGWWALRLRTVSDWPAYAAFRCLECESPAHVDPEDNRWWGCPACGVMTRRLGDRFRQAEQKDFPDHPTMWRAYWRAGMMCPAEKYEVSYEGSPVQAWARVHDQWKD